MAHRNARLNVRGRSLLVERVVGLGRPVAHVAKELGVSRQCAHRWITRYHQEGVAGLHDRPSRRDPGQDSTAVTSTPLIASKPARHLTRCDVWPTHSRNSIRRRHSPRLDSSIRTAMTFGVEMGHRLPLRRDNKGQRAPRDRERRRESAAGEVKRPYSCQRVQSCWRTDKHYRGRASKPLGGAGHHRRWCGRGT